MILRFVFFCVQLLESPATDYYFQLETLALSYQEENGRMKNSKALRILLPMRIYYKFMILDFHL
jgi:hypothetical protein